MSAERLDAIDFLIETLKQHERRLDRLISKLEKVLVKKVKNDSYRQILIRLEELEDLFNE